MRTTKERTSIAKPFLKWVGGKGQLLSQFEEVLPSQLYDEKFIYIEPFVGGGAMLFYMLQRFPWIETAVVNDINPHLMGAYLVVKEHPERLVSTLRLMETEYKSIRREDSRKDFYLSIRQQYNEETVDAVDKTAQLIFLNKTCFNGLYRENAKGKFNVPFGRYANPTICDEAVIYADSELLNRYKVQIVNGDFMQTIHYLDRATLNFIYFDPPYRPISATSSFNSYVKEVFDDVRQCDLAEYCRTLSRRKDCLWMLSNSDCSSQDSRDFFFERLYSGFHIHRVYATRSVNAIGSKRGKLSELLICNYENEQQSLNIVI